MTTVRDVVKEARPEADVPVRFKFYLWVMCQWGSDSDFRDIC